MTLIALDRSTGTAVVSLVLFGCPAEPGSSDTTIATSSDGTTLDASTPPASTSSPSDEPVDATGGSEASNGSTADTAAADTTVGPTGGPSGRLDCDALCQPYIGCDEGVYLSCEDNCAGVVPALVAVDDACGDTATDFFECFYGLSCEDAIAAHDDTLDPSPCEAERTHYIETCLAAVPPTCAGFCERFDECLESEPHECAFECLLLHGGVAERDDPGCDVALDGYLACFVDTECVDIEAGACEPVVEELRQACEQ